MKLAQLDLSQGELGARLVNAARTYFYGIEAKAAGNLVMYNRSLVSAYRILQINDADAIDLTAEIARCLRLMCCSRLGKIKEMKIEAEHLSTRWCRVKTILENGQQPWPTKEVGSKYFDPIDIAIHNDDLNYMSVKGTN